MYFILSTPTFNNGTWTSNEILYDRINMSCLFLQNCLQQCAMFEITILRYVKNLTGATAFWEIPFTAF